MVIFHGYVIDFQRVPDRVLIHRQRGLRSASWLVAKPSILYNASPAALFGLVGNHYINHILTIWVTIIHHYQALSAVVNHY
jgi:hypothetical protein